MKKVLALILVVLMALSFASCKGKERTLDEVTGGMETKGDDYFAQMLNKWVDCDSDTIAEYLDGFKFSVPDGATDVRFRWNSEIELAEMDFTLDDVEWCALTQQEDEFTDISGLYYDWDEENLGKSDENNALSPLKGTQQYCLLEEDNTVVCSGLWFDESAKLMYSLSAITPDVNDFSIASEVFDVK